LIAFSAKKGIFLNANSTMANIGSDKRVQSKLVGDFYCPPKFPKANWPFKNKTSSSEAESISVTQNL
jgi:hypothetical protein